MVYAAPIATPVRRLAVDAFGLIYDPRVGPASDADRADPFTLLETILDTDEDLAERWADDRLRETLVARSFGRAASDRPAAGDPFATGCELVARLEAALGVAACRAIDLGVVDIGDGFEPSLAAHLGGSVEELRRLVRRAFLPVEIAEG